MNAPLPKSAPLAGLLVELPTECCCGATVAEIETGDGQHQAGLRCGCGRHRGWVSGASHHFLTEVIARFGRPVEPIVIRDNPHSENSRPETAMHPAAISAPKQGSEPRCAPTESIGT